MEMVDQVQTSWVVQVSHGLKGTLLSRRGVILERAVVKATRTRNLWRVNTPFRKRKKGLNNTAKAVEGIAVVGAGSPNEETVEVDEDVVGL